MVDVTSDPSKQTGTGEPRSALERPSVPPDEPEHEDVSEPPDEEQTFQEVNRSGSGGSGGPREGDPREEGSGSASMEDMLAGEG
jgi:hypothetical protein